MQMMWEKDSFFCLFSSIRILVLHVLTSLHFVFLRLEERVKKPVFIGFKKWMDLSLVGFSPTDLV